MSLEEFRKLPPLPREIHASWKREGDGWKCPLCSTCNKARKHLTCDKDERHYVCDSCGFKGWIHQDADEQKYWWNYWSKR